MSALGLPLLDKTWNDAIEAAAIECEKDAQALRSMNSGGDGTEPSWAQADRLIEAAVSIRRLAKGFIRCPGCSGHECITECKYPGAYP